jgi:hypothetical protein
MTNIASVQTTTSRADTASPSVTTSHARNALVADAHSALLLGGKDAFRVSDNLQPSVVKAVPSGTCGIAFDPRLDQPLI